LKIIEKSMKNHFFGFLQCFTLYSYCHDIDFFLIKFHAIRSFLLQEVVVRNIKIGFFLFFCCKLLRGFNNQNSEKVRY